MVFTDNETEALRQLSIPPKVTQLVSRRVQFTSPYFWGNWVAQLVLHGTVDFGSDHDPRVGRWSPIISMLGMEPGLDSSSPSAPSPCIYVCGLKKKKKVSIFTTVVD